MSDTKRVMEKISETLEAEYKTVPITPAGRKIKADIVATKVMEAMVAHLEAVVAEGDDNVDE